MELQFIAEIARVFNLPPLIVGYLVALGWFHYKRAKDLDIAFQKIRDIERQLKEDLDA